MNGRSALTSRRVKRCELSANVIAANHVVLDVRVPSTLKLAPKRDQQVFRTALIHSAASLFVFVCGACAVLVFCILQPFIHSILWAILVGAFLFPSKSRCTTLALRYLQQLEADSHLLTYGLAVLLPLQIVDTTIESVGPLCIRSWKQIVVISLFLPFVEFLQSGLVYRWLNTVVYGYFLLFERYIPVFDSVGVILIVLGYLCTTLTVYQRSSFAQRLWKLCAVPVWCSFFLFSSQVIPVPYRSIVVSLTVTVTCAAYVIDQLTNRKRDEERKGSIAVSLASILMKLLRPSDRIRVYLRGATVKRSSSLSSSTACFTFVLCSLVAIKIYQFYWYLIPVCIVVVIYKVIKSTLIYTYTHLSQQTRVQQLIQHLIRFCQIRRSVLTPAPVHGIMRLIIKGDKKVNHTLQDCIDHLVTAGMIVILFIIALLGAILLVIQVCCSYSTFSLLLTFSLHRSNTKVCT